MPLYLPRRYRRPLLFPPGLLALAGLLWLGCVALGPWQERLKLKSVMQVIIPRAKPLFSDPYGSKNPWYFSSLELCAFRPWRDVVFTGNDGNDVYERTRVTNEVLTIMADTMHLGGVRVRFAPASRYKDLIFALDLLDRVGSKKHWLDTRHGAPTLYIYTDLQLHSGNSMECLGVELGSIHPMVLPTPPPFWTDFAHWATSFWSPTWMHTLFQALSQPEWRASAWFLAAIITLGSWRIIVPRRAPQTP